jgi:hypothetical protein
MIQAEALVASARSRTESCMIGKVIFVGRRRYELVGRRRYELVGLEECIECLWMLSLHWAFEGLLYAGNRPLG